MDKKYHVEGLLFSAKEPLSPEAIAKLVKEEESVVLRWLIELQNEFRERGIRIRQVAGGFEMVTASEIFETVEQILPKEHEDLSNSARQTLAVVAYKQPVSRSSIAQMRKVTNPDYGINALLERKLIKESEEGYVTTEIFLKFFGINDLKELPELDPAQAGDFGAEEEECEESAESKS